MMRVTQKEIDKLEKDMAAYLRDSGMGGSISYEYALSIIRFLKRNRSKDGGSK